MERQEQEATAPEDEPREIEPAVNTKPVPQGTILRSSGTRYWAPFKTLEDLDEVECDKVEEQFAMLYAIKLNVLASERASEIEMASEIVMDVETYSAMAANNRARPTRNHAQMYDGTTLYERNAINASTERGIVGPLGPTTQAMKPPW